MPTVGEQLRAAREARKLRVQEVAEATNMRTDHVIALEEGNYAPFPAPVYIRGSVRTYAKLLQLDVMRIMDDLSAEMKQQGQVEQASGGTGHRRGLLDFLALQVVRFGWKRSLIVIALLSVLALILLFRRTNEREPERDPLADLPPPTYQPAGGSAGGYLPLPGTNR
jgi:cytoskeletal protein RodZ